MAKSKSGKNRSGGPPAAENPSPPQGAASGKRVNPITFLQQVRAEGARTTWPGRRETGVTTVMVFIMVTLAALFFLLVDLVLQSGLGVILDLGG